MAGDEVANNQQEERVLVGVGNLVEGNREEDCSICLDEIGDGTQMGVSRLPCGHVFHLSCIGVAFNARGAMVCPNCRNVENNPWNYSPARDDDGHPHDRREEQQQINQLEEQAQAPAPDHGNDDDDDNDNDNDSIDINESMDTDGGGEDDDIDHFRMQINVASAGSGIENNNIPFMNLDYQLPEYNGHVHHHHQHVYPRHFNHAVISHNPNYGDHLFAHHHRHHADVASHVFQQFQSHQGSSVRLMGFQIQQPLPMIRSISHNLFAHQGSGPSSGIIGNGGNAGYHIHGIHSIYELNVPAAGTNSYHPNSHNAGLLFPDYHHRIASYQLPNSPISFPTTVGNGAAAAASVRNDMFSNMDQLQAELNQTNHPSVPYNNNNNPTVLQQPDISFTQMLQQVMMMNGQAEVQPPPSSLLNYCLPSTSTPPTTELLLPDHGPAVCLSCGCSMGGRDCLNLDLNLSIDGDKLYK